ncbi:hypothetical protein D3C86_1955880 [compost metagenome]
MPGQLLGVPDEGFHPVAAAQGLREDLGADEAGGANQNEVHGMVLLSDRVAGGLPFSLICNNVINTVTL